ncbi:MAG: DNA methyltransferase [Nocardioidaceae bacterium]
MTITREDAEEYSTSLAQIGEGWWRQVAWAFRQDVHGALGMSRREWREKYYGHLKMGSLEDRRESAEEMRNEGLSNREIADVQGVSEGTVRNDQYAGAQDYAPGPEPAENAQVRQDPQDAGAQDYAPGPEPAAEEEPSPATVEPLPPTSEVAPLEPLGPGWHELGPHRLYCGDSTDEGFVAMCDGAFAFADPPYNAGKAEWDEGFEWSHDYLAKVASIVAVTPGIASLKGFLELTEMPYQWSLAAEITNGMTRGALGFGNWIYVALFSEGSIYRNAKDCLRIPAHTGDDVGGGHASRKPLRLLTDLIGLFTSKGDTVIDPFLGSGTTLIAADRLDRRCIGAEMDPLHCAEIVARYRGRD